MDAEKKYKIEAYIEQFPALKDARYECGSRLGWRNADVFEVRRLNQDFLRHVPVLAEGREGSTVYWTQREAVIFLDEGGRVLRTVKCEVARHDPRVRARRLELRETGETVGDALADLSAQVLNWVTLVVSLTYGGIGRDDKDCLKMTVYRQPKAFTVQQWVADMRNKARQELAAELADVEAMAE